jgi:uncharacterized RDD family membrane protein YckC
MLVRFKCSQCGTSVKVDSQHAGKKAKCPGCGVPLQIPSLAEIEGVTRQPSPAPAVAAAPATPQFADQDFDFDVEPPQPSLASENPFLSPTTGYDPRYDAATTRRWYAGFWIRVLASIIDSLITGFFGGVIGFVLGFVGVALEMDMAILQLLNFVSGTILGWLYSALLESSSMQGTLGKMALGLRVVDENGRRISFARATGRHFAKWLSSLALCIGFIMVAFTEKKQGLHDMLAGTYVIRN